MNLPYTYSPNIWPAIIASLLIFGLAIYSFRYRDMPGALAFSIGCTLGLLWALGSIFEYSAIDVDVKIFWRKFQVLFQLPSATAITCFLLEYAWPKRYLTRQNLLLLWAVPVLAFLIIITNQIHHLFWKGFIFDERLAAVPGPLMKIFLGYVFVNFLINLLVLVWLFIHSPQNRWPVVIIVSGQIMMRVLYFIDISDRTLFNLPFAAVGIAFTSLMYAIVFFRYRILGPIPLANRAMMEQLPVGVIVLDDQEKIHNVNPTAEHMLNIKNKTAKGKNIKEVLPNYPQRLLHEDLEEKIEFSLALEDDKRYYTLEISFLRDWQEQHVGQLLILADVTDQRKAQAKILEQGRVLAILQERIQISRELHDDLAQIFTFIDTQGQTIRRLLNRGDLETCDKHLARLIDAAQSGEVDIRESIRGMRLTLSEHGLLATLENYLSQFTIDTSIHSNLTLSDDFDINRVNAMVEVQLLRILQEALTNIRKHAQASNVQIQFDNVNGSVCVTVQDDGRGFEVKPGEHMAANHFGIQMMQERVEAIGGTIRLDSQFGQGTKIKVCVPLNVESALE